MRTLPSIDASVLKIVETSPGFCSLRYVVVKLIKRMVKKRVKQILS